MNRAGAATVIFFITVFMILKAPVAGAAGFLADRHGGMKVACRACHGDTMPVPGDMVANGQCAACHGGYDRLARKTASGDPVCPDPHESHLGEIDCTLCHRGHSASVVYCLECHKTFNLQIPGASGE